MDVDWQADLDCWLVLMAIRNADTAGREETCQPTFGSPPPADPLPFPPANNTSAATGG
jgi:hypothetical protein